MYLSPEEEAIGRENFNAALGGDTKNADGVSRRDFLKAALAATFTTGSALGASYFGYDSVQTPLRVGVIGSGDQGGVLMGAVNPEYIQVTAICDIRPYNLHRAMHGDHYGPSALKFRCGLIQKYGWSGEDEARLHVRVYQDYADLHWAWCIRNPDPANRPRCDAKVGLANAVITLTAQMAARQGRRIEFREPWFDPDRDEAPEVVRS